MQKLNAMQRQCDRTGPAADHSGTRLRYLRSPRGPLRGELLDARDGGFRSITRSLQVDELEREVLKLRKLARELDLDRSILLEALYQRS